MLTLFSREFKSIFRNIKSVIALSLTALLAGILFLVNNLMTGYPTIEPVLSSMTLIAALTVPLVAIFSVSRERRDGSAAFISVLPFTKAQALLCKFLAVFAASMTSIAVVAIYPLVLALSGAKIYLNSYLGFLLLCAAVAFLSAFGLMLAYLFKRTWLAILISYSALALLFLLGTVAIIFESSALIAFIVFAALSLLVGALFWIATRRFIIGAAVAILGEVATLVAYFAFRDKLVNSISVFVKLISPFRRYDPVVFGLFDISSLIFYLSLTVVFLWFAYFGMKWRKVRAKGQKRAPVAARTSVAAALVVLVCLALNFAVSALPVKFTQLDTSDNRLYSVSAATKSFLKTLDKDITVYMIDKSGADERVVRYVERYCAQSDKITLKEVNTGKNPEFLSKYGLEGQSVPYCTLIVESESRWRIVSSEEFFAYYHEEIGYASPSELESYISYYSQMYSQYSGYVEQTQLEQLQSFIYSLTYDSKLCFKAEQSISEAIEYVCEEYIPAIYFLSGRGEKNTSANPLEIKGLSRIPDSVGLLIINSPTEDYSNAEIAILLEFAERGGRTVFLTNEANRSMPNLARLLDCYGLSVQEGVISSGDSDKIKAVSNTSGSTEVSIKGASAIKVSTRENITVEPLLTVDVEETVTDGEGADTKKTVTKTVAAVAYKNQQPTVALITGADTFNITSASGLSEEETQEYIVAMSFLQSISSGMKKGFESSLSFDSPKLYSTDVIAVEKSSAVIFGVILIGVVPLALLLIPVMNVYARKKRSSSK